jgi:hypothetical protein
MVGESQRSKMGVSKKPGKDMRIGNPFKAIASVLRTARMKVKEKRLRNKAASAKKYLQGIDSTMKAMGMSRQQVRKFWRDFFRYGDLREEFLK